MTDIIALYERHAAVYDRERGRGLQERAWLDRFAAVMPAGGTVLDLGCGMGEPIARHLIERGFRVTGVDSSPAMIALCRGRLPDAEWLVADMREFGLARRFDGIIAWDSFFHLSAADQRAMFPRFRALAAPGAALLFTSGPDAGEAIGSWCGEPLYHASLAPSEYRRLLGESGFGVHAHLPNDRDCGHHTVWLAVQEDGRQGPGLTPAADP